MKTNDYSKETLEKVIKLIIAAVLESEGVFPSFYIWGDLMPNLNDEEKTTVLKCLEFFEHRGQDEIT